MKKTLLTLAACIATLATVASVTGTFQKKDSARGYAFPEEVQGKSVVARELGAPNRAQEYDWEGTDTVAYFVMANNHVDSSYRFDINGAEMTTYRLGIARDGNEVTVTGLCNTRGLGIYSQVRELPVKGTYDEAAGTITIPTPRGVISASDGSYNYTLTACQFDEKGNMVGEPFDNLVFTVDEDLKTIRTDTSFGMAYMYGWGVRYASLEATRIEPGSAPKLNYQVTDIDFGTQFPGQTTEKTWVVINSGGSDAEYVISVDSDEDSFSSREVSGVIPAYSLYEITFCFTPPATGEYEGLATIETEDCDPVLVQFSGECIPVPDYSAIVEQGDFTFDTTIEHPFEIAQFEDPDQPGNMLTVAKSGTDGRWGESALKVKFTVPEGKLGKLSFKDYAINNKGAAYWYVLTSSICFDSTTTASFQRTATGFFPEEAMTHEFAAGEHYVYFHHVQNQVGEIGDGTYIWDLSLELEDALVDDAELTTPSVDLGNVLFNGDGGNIREGLLRLVNKGTSPLKVLSATSSSTEFVPYAPETTVNTMEELVIPVTFNAASVGKKSADITLETTAGSFVAKMTADVLENPDLMSLVTEGKEYVRMENNPEHPFLVENGMAWNITHGQTVDTETKSNFTMTINVEEGYIAKVSYDGHSWGSKETDYYNPDLVSQYGGVIAQIANGNSMSCGFYDNDVDAGSQSIIDRGEFFEQYFLVTKGTSTYEFYYTKTGYNPDVENDRLEISNIRVEMLKSGEYAAELVTETPVEFTPVYVGPQRWSREKITIRNLGTEPLYILDSQAAGPFSANVPDDQYGVMFLGNIDIYIWFWPQKEGDYTEDLVIKTTAGDIVVPCHGKTLSSEGIIYPGDFEDAAYGWMIYDADGDYDCWNLGSNMWGERETYCHSGSECLASASATADYGSIEPDNWTLSPNIYIPEEGGKLSYYVSSFHPTRFYEHYSMYIAEDFDGDMKSLLDAEPVIEETISEGADQDPETGMVLGWMYREIDLSKYAGKGITLAFRHHDCLGQYLLRLDDVFVYGDPSKVKGIEDADAHGILRQEVFDINGNRLHQLQNGVNIVKTYYQDGTSKSAKVMYRK